MTSHHVESVVPFKGMRVPFVSMQCCCLSEPCRTIKTQAFQMSSKAVICYSERIHAFWSVMDLKYHMPDTFVSHFSLTEILTHSFLFFLWIKPLMLPYGCPYRTCVSTANFSPAQPNYGFKDTFTWGRTQRAVTGTEGTHKRKHKRWRVSFL